MPLSNFSNEFLKGYRAVLNTKKLTLHYTPFKQLKSSLHETINRKIGFCIQFLQRTMMRMHIYMHGQQTGGEEINQAVIFLPRFANK